MRSLRAFLRDDRAVAPVVGFVLLFGIGVIAFSGYQAVQVPQQNAETEFQHYENVQNDLIVVRNAISRAGQQSQSQFESVRLGTQYRERALALNPPDPAGTLRTSEGYNITLDNGTTERNVTTRFLEYQNGYNELEIEPIYYENSVLYLDAESGQRVFFEDQNLVRDNGNTVVITALQREFSRSATGRVTLELYPTDGGAPLPLGEVSVTLPTQLPNSYWQGELAGEDPIIEGSYSYNERTETANQVSFTVESEDLEFNTVGIDNEPDQAGAVSNIDDDGSSDNGDNGGGGTTPGFLSVDASDLPKNNSPDSQMLSFTPSDSSIAADESVTINLDDAQSTGSQGEEKIDYQSASVGTADGSPDKGSSQFISQDENTAIIQYTADQEVLVGEQIQLNVSDIEYDSGDLEQNTVVFSRGDGGSASTTFSDGQSGGPPGQRRVRSVSTTFSHSG